MATPNERLDGAQFASSDGKRSSQQTGKEVFADAVASVDDGLARRILSVGDWRKGYLDPVRSVVVGGAGSAKSALTIASDGLDSMHRHLTFVREGGEITLESALEAQSKTRFNTGEVKGRAERIRELVIPYRREELRDDRLRGQLDDWVSAGVLEHSSANAIQELIKNPDWLDLSDQRFVLLGAASQMGPLGSMLAWGASVAAVDLPVRGIWDGVVGLARNGSGRLVFPTRAEPGADLETELDKAGVDLLTELPEVSSWMDSLDRPFVLGNYVYADGAKFLRLAGAVDSLIEHSQRKGHLSALAYLATPTDVFAVPDSLASEVRARKVGSPLSKALKFTSAGKLYQPNYGETIQGEDGSWGISDCLVPIQGPNYALSKSLQRWRAIVASDEEMVVSANVAPATRTTSVTKNRMLAAAYSQAHRFDIEIFEPETSSVLMAALLAHDLRSADSTTRPGAPLDHPFEIFVDKAVHGGIWRCAYDPRSVLPIALLRGMLSRPSR